MALAVGDDGRIITGEESDKERQCTGGEEGFTSRMQEHLSTSQADSSDEPSTGAVEENTIPDGGLRAIAQVISGFMLYLNSWGIVSAFGVFESFYATSILRDQTSSNIAWIGTMQGFLLAFMSIFAGPILDRGHPHWLIMVGGFMVVFGMMMTSLSTKYWQIFLAQGVCVGLGSGQIFIVAVALIPQWFERRRAAATGLAAAGSAVGGIIYPIAFHKLEPMIGFGWAVRVLGFIALFCILASLSVAKMRTLPPPRPKIVDFTGFREAQFTLFCVLSFFGAMGLYIPFFFITDYAQQREGIVSELSFYMLPILASGGVIGRTVPALLADKFGCLEMLSFTTSVAALLAFCWIAVTDSVPGIIIWSIFYGIFSGPFVSLQTPTIAVITPDMRIVGGRMGMCTFCLALGVLVGNPIAGVFQSHGSWLGLQLFCGSTLAISAVLTFAMLVVKGRQDRALERYQHNNDASNWLPTEHQQPARSPKDRPPSIPIMLFDRTPIKIGLSRGKDRHSPPNSKSSS